VGAPPAVPKYGRPGANVESTRNSVSGAGTSGRLPLRPEALAVFARDDKGLDHLGVDEVAVELIEFI
jgi:hypothetical protein